MSKALAVPGLLELPHLADTTVWSKVRPIPVLADWFNAEVRAGRILTCEMVNLELLRSAQGAVAYRRQADLLALLSECPLGRDEYTRSREVQQGLAQRGHHRGVPPADLLIAAAAEAAGVAVLHYDHDYDLIAQVTAQPTRWLLPAGSLP